MAPCLKRIVCTAFVGCAVLAGCSQGPSEEVLKARQLLPVGESQAAIDALGAEETPEALYLKAVALNRLDLRDAAIDKLAQAEKKAPAELKYHIYRLVLVADPKSADEVIKAHVEHKSSAALCLFASWGYAQKGDLNAAVEALKTAITLSSEIPELMPDMLKFAISSELPEQAMAILDKLEQMKPNDPKLRQRRIVVLTLLKESQKAATLAKVDFEAGDSKDPTLYMRTLVASEPTPENDKLIVGLLNQFPGNPELITQYSQYLARTNRVPEAVSFLESAAATAQKEALKSVWLKASILLPLEARNGAVAAQQLKKHRAAIKEPLQATLFEGRIAFLNRELDTAATKLRSVIEEAKNLPEPQRQLANEAYVWLLEVEHDRDAAKAMDKALNSIPTSIPPHVDSILVPKMETPKKAP